MTQLTDLSYNVLTEMYRATRDKKHYYKSLENLITMETGKEVVIMEVEQ